MAAISFSDTDLARRVEALTEDEIDCLPFGAVRLDRDGSVTFYSKTERTQSGYQSRPALGRNFFLDIAPCMADNAFRDRIEAACLAGELDVELGWIGDFADPDREMVIRIQSTADGGMWIFLSREI